MTRLVMLQINVMTRKGYHISTWMSLWWSNICIGRAQLGATFSSSVTSPLPSTHPPPHPSSDFFKLCAIYLAPSAVIYRSCFVLRVPQFIFLLLAKITTFSLKMSFFSRVLGGNTPENQQSGADTVRKYNWIILICQNVFFWSIKHTHILYWYSIVNYI